MNPNNKEFKALQAVWYKKLGEQGFQDIEQDESLLKNWASHFFRSKRWNEIKFNSTRDYYIMAEHFLNSYKFSDTKEKLIWEMHSKGISVNKTVDFIRHKLGTKTSVDTVRSILKSLKAKMIKANKNDR